MSSTASDRSGVDDLGPDALLRRPQATPRYAAGEAELDQLQLAYQWCVLHPATPDTGTAAWGGDGNLDTAESLGGDGTPTVAAFAPEPLGLALGVPTRTAMTLIADALDLVHRLPHTWRRAQTLDIPIWRARRVAQKTHALIGDGRRPRRPGPRPPAAHPRGHPPRPHHRPGHRHPHARGARGPRGTPGRPGTWSLHHPNPTEYAGTSELHVVGDTMTLTHLYDRICATAAHLKTHGDPAPLGVRKARALAQLAGTRGPSSTCTSTPTHPSAGPRSSDPPPLATDHATGSGTPGSPSNPSSTPTAPTRSTPTTHPPGCATWSSSATPAACSRTANATPAAATSTTPSPTTTPAHPAKPDQTNLAPLCRRHHRAKTTGRWQYRRQPDGTYQWTGPGCGRALRTQVRQTGRIK